MRFFFAKIPVLTIHYYIQEVFSSNEVHFSKIVMFYENPKYGSSRMSGLYGEARLHFLGYRDILIWYVITVDNNPGHTSTHRYVITVDDIPGHTITHRHVITVDISGHRHMQTLAHTCKQGSGKKKNKIRRWGRLTVW